MIKITFTGDIMCQRQLLASAYVKHGKYDFHNCFTAIRPLFADSDYVVGNLETPVSNTTPVVSSAISFNAPLSWLTALKEVGFHFLATANNHCLDRGLQGLDDTIHNLDTFGFDHDGTYLHLEDSNRLVIMSGRKPFLCTI